MNLNEKISALKNKELERLSVKLKVAKGNYNDTGEDRYYRQIKRFEEEINFIDGTQPVTVTEVNFLKDIHRKHMQAIKKRAEEFVQEEPLNIEFKHFCKWLNDYLEYIEKECY